MWSSAFKKYLVKRRVIIIVRKVIHKKINCILLILLIMWTVTLLITEISDLTQSVHLVMQEFDDRLQFDIRNLSYGLVNILSFTMIAIFSMITIFKPRWIKIIGIIIIVQNIIILSINYWHEFFTDWINVIYVDIKWYLIITAIVVLIIGYLSNTIPKIFISVLGCVTITQTIISIYYVNHYINSFFEIGVFNMFRYYCSLTIILILYCLLLFNQNKIIDYARE